MKNAITEEQLVMPSLIILSQADDLTSSKTLRKLLRKILNPSEIDDKLVNNKKQKSFDKKVQNLVSHRKLQEWASYHKVESKMYMKINKKGRTKVEKHFKEMD